MEESAVFVAIGVLTIVSTALFFLLLCRSPIFAWVVSIISLLAWGIFPLGIAAFVIFRIYLPRGSYVTAMASAILAAVITIPWATLGIPAIVKNVKESRRHFVLWR